MSPNPEPAPANAGADLPVTASPISPAVAEFRARQAYRVETPAEESAWTPVAADAVKAAASSGRPDHDGLQSGAGDRRRWDHAPAAAVLATATAGPVLRAGQMPFADPVALAADAGVVSSLLTEPTVSGERLNPAIVRSLRVQYQQGGGEARLTLNPEYLGELTVSLKVQGSSVTAVLQSDSPAVRGWIEAHQAELKKQLEDAGLTLDQLVVDKDGDPRQQARQQADSRQPRHAPRRHAPQEGPQFAQLLQ